MIDASDRTRGHYIRTLTGLDWKDARQYHLSLDTSALGLDNTENIILTYLQPRFGIII
jgi:CMP/dCMP kinase